MSALPEWTLETLKSAKVTLLDCDHKTPKAQDCGRPYVGIPQLKYGRISLEGARLISEDDFHLWRRKTKPSPHDIILSRRCNPGVTAYVPEGLEIALGQNLVLLRASGEKMFPPFLRWVVQGPIWWGQVRTFLNTGAVFESLKCADIPKFEIKLPPLPEQKAIADMLSSFDEKIEMLREQNKTLETLAQTIFKEWFVHFNYPDATGEMVDSELGEIPKGWRVGKLSDIADFLNGLALQKYPPIKGKETLPVIKIRELKQGVTVQTDRANTELNKKYIINNGDILFSWSGSLEVVIWKYGQGALNQHLFKVSSETYSKWFYYYWTLFHLREFRSIAANKATTMGHIQRKHLDEAKVLISSDDIMNQGTALFTPMIEKIIITNEQIQTLSKSRDTLLPKLMSGQVRV